MSQEEALKNFNLEKDLLGEGKLKIPFLPVFCALTLYIFTYIIATSEDIYPSQLYPIHLPVIMGLVYLFIGIITLDNSNLQPDQKVDSAGLLVMGGLLLGYAFLKLTSKTLPPLSMTFAFTCAVKNILVYTIRSTMRNTRCSLSVNAVCIGVLREERYKDSKSFERINVYHPVWEYKVPVPGKALSENDIVPVLENRMVEKSYRRSCTPWAEQGTPKYGDSRPLRVNPKNPEEIYEDERFAIPLLYASLVALLFSSCISLGLLR